MKKLNPLQVPCKYRTCCRRVKGAGSASRAGAKQSPNPTFLRVGSCSSLRVCPSPNLPFSKGLLFPKIISIQPVLVSLTFVFPYK